MRRSIALLLAPVLTALAQEPAPPVGEGPEPSPTPISWEFELKYLDLRRIEVQFPGAAEPEAYWYMVYTATNTSGSTQYFYPTFQIVTDDLRLIDADVGVSKLVYDAIHERHGRTHKYLVHPTKAVGNLKVGDDNARESVAIWRTADLDVSEFTTYVAGLSGEARLIRNPVYDPARPETVAMTDPDGRERETTVNPRTFTLRKTLAIRYRLPGSAGARSATMPERVSARWIMR